MFSKNCTSFFLDGDFNSGEAETVLPEFLNSHDAKNMIKVNLSSHKKLRYL